jgi:hypothetical protein
MAFIFDFTMRFILRMRLDRAMRTFFHMLRLPRLLSHVRTGVQSNLHLILCSVSSVCCLGHVLHVIATCDYYPAMLGANGGRVWL